MINLIISIFICINTLELFRIVKKYLEMVININFGQLFAFLENFRCRLSHLWEPSREPNQEPIWDPTCWNPETIPNEFPERLQQV